MGNQSDTLSCSPSVGMHIDINEFAIHKESGIPQGRLSSNAMQYLSASERYLLFAAAGTSRDLVREYINSGISANTFDENRTSPLHIASRYGNLEVLNELIEQECSVNITDCAGWTCLHVAAHCQRPEVVKILLEAEGDPTSVNSNGQTPYDVARDPATRSVFKEYWNSKPNAATPRISNISSNFLLDTTDEAEDWNSFGNIPYLSLPSSAVKISTSLFDLNGPKSLSLLIMSKEVPQEPKKIAEFLFQKDLSPLQRGTVLATQSLFVLETAIDFMELLDFPNCNFVDAIRRLLKLVKFPVKNSQIVDAFAESYWSDMCPFESRSTVIIFLNIVLGLSEALHKDSNSLSEEMFIKSCLGLHEGKDFPDLFLKWVFSQVKTGSLHPEHCKKETCLFEEAVASGKLEYSVVNETRHGQFVLTENVLWVVKEEREPYALMLLEEATVSVQEEEIVIENATLVKLNSEGSLKISHKHRFLFKTQSPEWKEAFKQI